MTEFSLDTSIKRKICQLKHIHKTDVEISGADLKIVMINLLKNLQQKMTIMNDDINISGDIKTIKQNKATKKKLWN